MGKNNTGNRSKKHSGLNQDGAFKEMRIRLNPNYQTAFRRYEDMLRGSPRPTARASLFREVAASRLFAFLSSPIHIQDSDAMTFLDADGRLHYMRVDTIVVNHARSQNNNDTIRTLDLPFEIHMSEANFKHLLERAPLGNGIDHIRDLWVSHGQVVRAFGATLSDESGVPQSIDYDGINVKYLESNVDADSGDIFKVVRYALMSPNYLIRRVPGRSSDPKRLDRSTHNLSGVTYNLPTLQARISAVVSKGVYPRLSDFEGQDLDPVTRNHIHANPHDQWGQQIGLSVTLPHSTKLKGRLKELSKISSLTFNSDNTFNEDQVAKQLKMLDEHYKWRIGQLGEPEHLGERERIEYEALTRSRETIAETRANIKESAMIYTLELPYVPLVCGSRFRFRWRRPCVWELPSRSLKGYVKLVQNALTRAITVLNIESDDVSQDEYDVLWQRIMEHKAVKDEIKRIAARGEMAEDVRAEEIQALLEQRCPDLEVPRFEGWSGSC